MRSLTSRLLALWAMSLAACIAVGLLLVQLYRQSTVAQVQRGEAVVAEACSMIRDRYQFYVSGWAGGPLDQDTRAGLTAVVTAALRGRQGVEGGIWQGGAGSLAYAYPTYPGSGPKLDIPAAEIGRIVAINQAARREEQPVLQRGKAGAETLLLAACLLPGPVETLTAWTMTRVRTVAGLESLQAGLGVLLALVIGMSLWLARLVIAWSRSLRAIETTLRAHKAGALPELGPTGERELDRLVLALNQTGQRLAEARERSDQLARQVAASERLAALGRIAAGVAHEIRNPIAAMRIKAESAQRGDDERRRRAIEVILGQIERLDHLVSELLTMTQRRQPQPRDVSLPDTVQDIVADYRDQAAAMAVDLRAESARERVLLDPDLLRRVLGNLLLNALQHTPPGGTVTLAATVAGSRLRLLVADTGAGIRPELRETMFEPFVTGRAGGTGLGLPIARELVDAMGGRLTLAATEGTGARFLVDLPMDGRCPAS